MSSSVALRHVRQVTTATAAAAAATTTSTTSSKTVSLSKAKSKLKSEFNPDKALQIYNSVSNQYTSPLSTRYTQEFTVRRLLKSHRFSEIETLLESHKTDPRITQEPFLSTIIRSYGVAGMIDHAKRTYDQMPDLKTPRSVASFNTLLTACIHNKLFDTAIDLFETIPKRDNIEPDTISYGILIRAYCGRGCPEDGIKKLREMEEKGLEVNTIMYTSILHRLYKDGKAEEAGMLWDEMVKKSGVDVGAYNVRIFSIYRDDPEGIKSVIKEMEKSGLKPDTISYNYLMSSYCLQGMMDKAKEVYEKLDECGCKPNAATIRILVLYLCKHEQFEEAFKVYKQGIGMNKLPDFNTMQYLVRGLVKVNKVLAAKGIIRRMQKKFPPNLLNAWKQLSEEIGLADADVNEGDVSSEVQKANT